MSDGAARLLSGLVLTAHGLLNATTRRSAVRSHSVTISVLTALFTTHTMLAAEPQPRFEGQVRVNNVTVEVDVRDDTGAPVTHLDRRDFRLFEDGSEQDITNFLEVAGGRHASSPLDPQPAPPEVGPLVERRLVVFFDLYLMTEQAKRSVLERLGPTLQAGLPEGLLVAIASFDGSLRIHTGLVADPATLARALAEVRALPATGRQRQVELASADLFAPIGQEDRLATALNRRARYTSSSRWLRTLARVRYLDGELGARARSNAYWAEVQHGVRAVSGAFTATLQRFSASPVRKLALLVSPGRPAADPLMDDDVIGELFDQPQAAREAGLLSPVAAVASSLGYTLFTLDPSGTQVFGGDASQAYPSPDPAPFLGRSWIESDRKSNLIRAAELTGGAAVFMADAGVGMKDVLDRTETYYSLAFQPSHAGDDREHEIEVRVVGHPDYHLAYRRRYVDLSVEKREAERARSALLAGDGGNSLALDLVVDPPKRRARLGGPIRTVDVDLRIPFAHLTMVLRGEVSWGQVLLAILAVDPKGNQSELSTRLIPVTLKTSLLEDARRNGYFSYTFQLVIDKGLTSIRVAVVDTLAHDISTVTADVEA